MPLSLPSDLAGRIDQIVACYPAAHPRAPALWLLHLLQEHYGCLGAEQVEWAAARLGVPAIDVWELVSFYPMFSERPRGRFHLKVCRSLSCELGGCRELLVRIQRRLAVGADETTADGRFTLSTFECLADCGRGPVLMVNDELYEHVTGEAAEALIDQLAATGRLEPVSLPPVPPPHPLERRILLAGLSDPDYDPSLAGYLRRGGYEALRRAVALEPQAVVQEVLKSELRGRGGAGFPTGRKWSFVDQQGGRPVYLVCNGDESEPGTFKDRVLLHHAPHLLIEGIVISCYALGARTAYVYLRGEFPKAVGILEAALAEARAQGLVGHDVLGRGFDCEIHLHRGAGAYICGEETGLIESLEGKRAYPRIKPPFPAVHGLFGCPTAVNNVETLCNIPAIVERGADWYLQLGVPGSRGTRIVCVSGRVQRPGYYEIEMGKLTLRQLVDEVCGGPLPGRTVKGVIPGGSSMPVLTPDQLDVTLDFDAIQKAGSMAGSGGVIVLDDATDIVATTLNVTRFYAHESCGQCTPCREGVLWMEKVLQRLADGQGRPQDPALLAQIADHIDGKTICPLGAAAAWPVKAFTGKYAQEFAAAAAPGPEGKPL